MLFWYLERTLLRVEPNPFSDMNLQVCVASLWVCNLVVQSCLYITLPTIGLQWGLSIIIFIHRGTEWITNCISSNYLKLIFELAFSKFVYSVRKVGMQSDHSNINSCATWLVKKTRLNLKFNKDAKKDQAGHSNATISPSKYSFVLLCLFWLTTKYFFLHSQYFQRMIFMIMLLDFVIMKK